jgi:hypothetical protein
MVLVCSDENLGIVFITSIDNKIIKNNNINGNKTNIQEIVEYPLAHKKLRNQVQIAINTNLTKINNPETYGNAHTKLIPHIIKYSKAGAQSFIYNINI